MNKHLAILCIILFSVSLYSEKATKKKETPNPSPIIETNGELPDENKGDKEDISEESKDDISLKTEGEIFNKNLEKILKVCKEYKFIKENSPEQDTPDKSCQKLKIEYEKEKSLLENYKNILNKIQISKFMEANSEIFEKELKLKLKKKIDSIINKHRNQLIDSHLKYLEENNRPFAIQEDAINVPSIALTSLFFLFTTFLILYYNKKLKTTLELSNKEISELKQQVSTLSNSTELKEKVNRLSSMSKDIENIKDDLINIHRKLNERPVTTQKETAHYPQKSVEEIYDEYFFSNPTTNGDFTDAYKKKTYTPNESIYRFLVNKNGNSAKFTFIDDESAIKTAIRIASSYIEPVCENVNPRNPSAKSIKTIEPGTAVKEGNIWKVIKKARIQYE